MAKLQRNTLPDWRDHVGGEIVALSLLLLGSTLLAVWRASHQAEDSLNARTSARLLPPQKPAPATTGAD